MAFLANWRLRLCILSGDHVSDKTKTYWVETSAETSKFIYCYDATVPSSLFNYTSRFYLILIGLLLFPQKIVVRCVKNLWFSSERKLDCSKTGFL